VHSVPLQSSAKESYGLFRSTTLAVSRHAKWKPLWVGQQQHRFYETSGGADGPRAKRAHKRPPTPAGPASFQTEPLKT
jgi:hypothetical protein